MKKYMFTNITGSYVFNENFKIIDKILFRSVNEYANKKTAEEKLRKGHTVHDMDAKHQFQALSALKDCRQFNLFRKLNLEYTKKSIKSSVSEDNFIIQSVSNIDELEKVINTLVKRLREWYELYNPEFSRSISNHEAFVRLILEKDKKQLLKEINIKETMGADFSDDDKRAMFNLTETIVELYVLRSKHETYLGYILKRYCPNINAIAGTMIAAKLVQRAGSLKKLALFPASTLQLLGAEKALFRHMKIGASCPKYGLIINHPFITKAKNKGKAARMLADKLSIAARIDFYKGNFIGDKMIEELEKRMP